MEDMSVKKL